MVEYKETIGKDGKTYRYQRKDSKSSWTRVKAAKVAQKPAKKPAQKALNKSVTFKDTMNISYRPVALDRTGQMDLTRGQTPRRFVDLDQTGNLVDITQTKIKKEHRFVDLDRTGNLVDVTQVKIKKEQTPQRFIGLDDTVSLRPQRGYNPFLDDDLDALAPVKINAAKADRPLNKARSATPIKALTPINLSYKLQSPVKPIVAPVEEKGIFESLFQPIADLVAPILGTEEKAPSDISSLKKTASQVMNGQGCEDVKKQVEELKKEYDSLEASGKLLGYMFTRATNDNKVLKREAEKQEAARKRYELKYERLKQLTRKEFVHRGALKKFCQQNPDQCNVYLNTAAYVLKENLKDQESYLKYIHDLVFAMNSEVISICKGNEAVADVGDCFKVRSYAQKAAWAKDHYTVKQLLRARKLMK